MEWFGAKIIEYFSFLLFDFSEEGCPVVLDSLKFTENLNLALKS